MLTITKNLLKKKLLLNFHLKSFLSSAITSNLQINWFLLTLKKYYLYFQLSQKMRSIRSLSISSPLVPSLMYKPQNYLIRKLSNQVLIPMRSLRLRTHFLLLMLRKLTKFRKLSIVLLNPNLVFR